MPKSKLKPKQALSRYPTLSASKFYDFCPCKPWAQEIVFTKRKFVLYPILFERKTHKNKQATKRKHEKQFRKHEYFDRLQTLHVFVLLWWQRGYYIEFVDTAHDMLSRFSPLEIQNKKYKSRAECFSFIAAHLFGWRNEFRHNLRKLRTCQPSAAHTTWTR